MQTNAARQVVLRVQVTACVSTAVAHIVVADNGIGVPAQDRYKLFKLFKRLYTGHQFEGNGLGPAVCHQVAQAHGGSIELLDSPDGQGSRFELTLPLAMAPAATATNL